MATTAEWLSRLVQIPSVAPPQAGLRAGVPGEQRLALQLAHWFHEIGGAVEIIDVLPGRPNVYGRWPGRGDQLAGLDVHTDTAGVEQVRGDPFSGAIRDGRVYGRGAVDTKASLAVALALLEELQEAGEQPAANFILAATADEEEGALGAPAFAEWARQNGLLFDQLVVAEPTGCAPIIGHKGVVRMELEFAGIAAHSSQPELGRNAITAAARVALAFDAEHQRLQQGPATPLGHAALTVSRIEGGRGINVVPDSCRLAFDRRLVASERPTAIIQQLGELAQAASPLPISSRILLALDSFWQNPADPWIQQIAGWAGQVPGMAGYGTNAWAYASITRACVVLGPGSIAQAHSDDEWVEVAELERLSAIYRRWWGIRN